MVPTRTHNRHDQSPSLSVLDVGCGDGRILIRSLQRGAVKAEGWELDKTVFELAEAHVRGCLDGDLLARSKLVNHDALEGSKDRY